MAQPSLKIKLRLNSQQDSKVSTPESSLASSAPSSPKQSSRSESSQLEPPAKRSRSSKSRKPATPQTASTPTGGGSDTPNTANLEDQGTPSSSTPSRSQTQTQKASSRIKAIFAHKDIPARKWKRNPLKFYTMGGGIVELPIGCWQSDEKMKLNKNPSEPTTMADIDQLFAMEKDFRPFLCTHANCSKSFTSFDQLQTHETNMHGIKKLVCGIDHCQKSFATSGQLTKHRKMVHFRAQRRARLDELKKQEEAAAAASASASATEDGNNNNDDSNADTPMTTTSTQVNDDDSS